MSKVITAQELYTPEFVRKYNTLQQQFFTKRTDPARTFLYGAVQSHLNPGDYILDVGCGNGDDVRYYQSKAYAAFGIDSAEAMVELAREKVHWKDRITCGNFLTVRPESLGRFDAITTRFALHYVANIDQAYRRMARLLNPHGIVAIITAHPFKDAQFSKTPRPGEPRIVRYPLFNGQIIMEYPAHEMHEYFSKTFFELFELLAFDEEPAKYREHNNIPGHLGILARKK